jgi:hypothetical protein
MKLQSLVVSVRVEPDVEGSESAPKVANLAGEGQDTKQR